MKPNEHTAAICGLFCGTCPSYPKECEGCLSDRVAPGCDRCGNGFRDCARQHNATRCYECPEFPCARLEDFSKQHIENGICHHEQVIHNLSAMKKSGVGAWVEAQTRENTCPDCGRLIPWYERGCPACAGALTGAK